MNSRSILILIRKKKKIHGGYRFEQFATSSGLELQTVRSANRYHTFLKKIT